MAMFRTALGRVSRDGDVSHAVGKGFPPPIGTLRRSPFGHAASQTSSQQPMRTFMSPAAIGAALRTSGVSNFQGWCSHQKRFLSVERKEPYDTGVVAWLDRNIDPRHPLMVVIVAGVSSFVAMTVAY